MNALFLSKTIRSWRVLLGVLLCGVAAPALSVGLDEQYLQVRGFFPQADRVGAPEGQPPAAPKSEKAKKGSVPFYRPGKRVLTPFSLFRTSRYGKQRGGDARLRSLCSWRVWGC